jgi:hypothetical protein
MDGLPEFLVVLTFVNESNPEELLSNVVVVWEEVQVALDHISRASTAANQTLRYLGGKSHFLRFFGDFVTSFASSRLASVTCDIRENFREFGGL